MLKIKLRIFKIIDLLLNQNYLLIVIITYRKITKPDSAYYEIRFGVQQKPIWRIMKSVFVLFSTVKITENIIKVPKGI